MIFEQKRTCRNAGGHFSCCSVEWLAIGSHFFCKKDLVNHLCRKMYCDPMSPRYIMMTSWESWVIQADFAGDLGSYGRQLRALRTVRISLRGWPSPSWWGAMLGVKWGGADALGVVDWGTSVSSKIGHNMV